MKRTNAELKRIHRYGQRHKEVRLTESMNRGYAKIMGLHTQMLRELGVPERPVKKPSVTTMLGQDLAKLL